MFGGRGIHIHPADGVTFESKGRVGWKRRHSFVTAGPLLYYVVLRVGWAMLYIGFSPTHTERMCRQDANLQARRIIP